MSTELATELPFEVGSTEIKKFYDSPQEFFETFIAGTMEFRPTRQTEIGSAVHAILLDDAKPEDIAAVYPSSCLKSNGAINPNPAKLFREESEQQYFFKQPDMDIVLRAVEVARSSPIGEAVAASTSCEHVLRWRDEATGLPCRMTPDIACVMEDRVVIHDLKTTEQVKPDNFKMVSKRLRYWLQEIHYRMGAEALFNRPVSFSFLAIEVQHPFRVGSYFYTPQSMEVARDAWRGKMDDLGRRVQSGDWSDPWTHEATALEIGPWDVEGADEMEVEVEV